jgi:6-phosphogluconolactonase (cycloisomerase 2 family)
MLRTIFLASAFVLALSSLLHALPGNGLGVAGGVYTMTNDPGGNHVLAFDRLADGTLVPAGAYATGGLGTGSGLGNQGGIVLSDNGRWLFVVNAGSDDVSVFAVTSDGLQLTDTVASGGLRPVSVTVHNDLVYILNNGGSVGDVDNIAGYWLGNDGTLHALAGSLQPLSAASTAPAQIGFSPDGTVLVVTEKATNSIDTYAVGIDGLPGAPTTWASPGQTPFGFSFGHRRQLFVSEAAGGAPDASSVSSYAVSRDGDLTLIDASVATTETAACWLQTTGNGRYAFTANTPADSVTGFAIAPDGTLSLLNADGQTAILPAGSGPLDNAVSRDGRTFYTLNIGNGSIGVFRIHADGSLIPLADVTGLPAGLNGLAAL